VEVIKNQWVASKKCTMNEEVNIYDW
jgi:hypothetical protein